MQLNLIFPNILEFSQALEFFASEISTFTVEYVNEEFKTLGFGVSSEDDANWTEQLLFDELCVGGFQNFHFELEPND